MLLALLTTAALAGDLYVNGTFVDPRSIQGTTLEDVSVRVDAQGNILVDAPGYKIEVMGGGAAPPAPPPAYGTPPQPYAQPAAQPAPYGQPPAYAPAPRPAAAAAPPPAGNNGVARARWWLVTEDNGSRGHTVDIIVNERLVQTVRSGEPQKILDVGAYLQPGANRVKIQSNSAGAAGGTFYVYMGSGTDQSGTVVMEQLQVQFGIGQSRNGPFQREYTLNVN